MLVANLSLFFFSLSISLYLSLFSVFLGGEGAVPLEQKLLPDGLFVLDN